MCEVDWGLLANVVSAVASVATFVVAAIALTAWRAQLSGTTRHQAANRITTAARALRIAFYESRSPMIEAWEFPRSYRDRPIGQRPNNAELAHEYGHAYDGRLKELRPYLLRLARLRPAAGAVLGEPVADAAEALVRKARELQFLMRQHVRQLSDGPEVVAMWTDQAHVARVEACVLKGKPHDDDFSKEFEALFVELLKDIESALKWHTWRARLRRFFEASMKWTVAR
jgi:hypothetical protein